MFFMAILAAACFGGWRAGLLATALGALVVVYFFIEPRYSLAIPRSGDRFQVLLFVIVGAAVSLVADVMLGFSPEEVLQLHVWDWDAQWTPEQLKVMLRLVDKAGSHFETRHRRKDGTCCDVEISNNAAEWRGQKLVFCVCRDITQRKAAADALRESEEHYRIVADHTYDWEYWLTPDGKLTYCSPSCERLTGYRSDECAYDPALLRRIVHPDDDALWHQHLLDDISNPETCTLDWRIVTRQGETGWIAHVCTPVYTSDGRVLGRRASNRDITARKRAEQALRESHERFQRALECIPDVVVIYDRDLTIQYINDAARQLTGRPVSDYIGKRDEEVWPPEVYEAYLPTLREAFHTRTLRALETNLLLPGCCRWPAGRPWSRWHLLPNREALHH